jgi:hypothetical protein
MGHKGFVSHYMGQLLVMHESYVGHEGHTRVKNHIWANHESFMGHVCVIMDHNGHTWVIRVIRGPYMCHIWVNYWSCMSHTWIIRVMHGSNGSM